MKVAVDIVIHDIQGDNAKKVLGELEKLVKEIEEANKTYSEIIRKKETERENHMIGTETMDPGQVEVNIDPKTGKKIKPPKKGGCCNIF